MTHILGERGIASLAQLARSRTFVAFDFDGTLAPIVADRDVAAMGARTRELVAEVSRRYPCAVISGRARDDVAARVEGTGIRHVVGNHGLEPSEGMEAFERTTKEAFSLLSAALAGCDGLDFEHKRFSFAVHYRRARDREGARNAIDEAVARLRVALRVVPGRLVVNLVPAGAPTKGDAFLRLQAEEGCGTALFVGDDETDEDVFRLDAAAGMVGVRVGPSERTAARWYLRDQQEVNLLLGALVSLRDEAAR